MLRHCLQIRPFWACHVHVWVLSFLGLPCTCMSVVLFGLAMYMYECCPFWACHVHVWVLILCLENYSLEGQVGEHITPEPLFWHYFDISFWHPFFVLFGQMINIKSVGNWVELIISWHHTTINYRRDSASLNYSISILLVWRKMLTSFMGRVKRIWQLPPMRAAKVRAILRLARISAARSNKQWVKRNLQTESQIPGPSEWLGMSS